MSEIPAEVEAALADIKAAAQELLVAVDGFIATVKQVVLDQVEAKLDADDEPTVQADDVNLNATP